MVGSLRASVARLRSSVTVAVAAALPLEIRESGELVPRMVDVGAAGRDRAELVPDSTSGASPPGGGAGDRETRDGGLVAWAPGRALGQLCAGRARERNEKSDALRTQPVG
jgi:hypothetical protein